MDMKIAFKVILYLLLGIIIFASCQSIDAEMNLINNENAHAIHSPLLLAEWDMGNIRDIAWSPKSDFFAVNYFSNKDDEANYHLCMYDISTLEKLWEEENSKSMNLSFTYDGKLLVEPHTFPPVLSLRDSESGQLINQLESDGTSCKGGGQLILPGSSKNTFFVADTKDLIGLNTNNVVNIMKWDIEANRCTKVIQYRGDFDIFDINSTDTLLAYGSLIEDDSIIIWDIEKQEEICRVPIVDHGSFVPGQDTLAIFRDQKMLFFDTSTCQIINELAFTTIGTNLAFSSDGERFAIANESIMVVDTDTGTTLTKIPYPEDATPYNSKLLPSGIEFSPDGKYLLLAFSTGAYSGRIQLWQIPD